MIYITDSNTWLSLYCVCVAVRERQYRYLQAAHSNVYQAFDEDILPFVDLTQHHEQQVAQEHQAVQEQQAAKPSAVPPVPVQHHEEEEEEEEDDDDDDEPTDYAQVSFENILTADDPLAELDEHTSEDVNDNN